MTKAFDLGVNFFDNAEGYAHGNAEVVMGNVIKNVGWKRSFSEFLELIAYLRT